MKFKSTISSNKFCRLIGIGSFCLVLWFSAALPAQAQTTNRTVKSKIQRVTVEVTRNGYQPSTLRLRRGIPARLTFIRRVEGTCATEVVFPAYGVNRQLPLNKAVIIKLTPKTSGAFTFACGMNMLRGKLIVQ